MDRDSFYERPNTFFLHMPLSFYDDKNYDPRWDADIGVMFTEPGEPGYLGPHAREHDEAHRDGSDSPIAVTTIIDRPSHPASPARAFGHSRHDAGLRTPNRPRPRQSSVSPSHFDLNVIDASPSPAASTIHVAQEPPSSSEYSPGSRGSEAPSSIIDQRHSSAPAQRANSKVAGASAGRRRAAARVSPKSTTSRSSAKTSNSSDPYYTASFPPGRDSPSFVPFGRQGRASVAQGNYWPIDIALRDRIALGEMDGQGLRGANDRITSAQLLVKYSAWQGGVTASTMRGRVRNLVLPPEHRERVPTWGSEHVWALMRAVPACRNSNGQTDWRGVKAAVVRETGKPFGVPAMMKKWKAMRRSGKAARGRRAQEEEEAEEESDEDDEDFGD